MKKKEQKIDTTSRYSETNIEFVDQDDEQEVISMLRYSMDYGAKSYRSPDTQYSGNYQFND